MQVVDSMSIENEPKVGGHIYQVNPPVSREEMTAMRKRCGMSPATFHYQDPTPEIQADPLWKAIWDEIKTWDINVPTEYAGYCGATGNHVTAIYWAIDEMKAEIDNHVVRTIDDLKRRFDLIEATGFATGVEDVLELKKQIQVAHNVLLTEFGRKCSPAGKCAVCIEIELFLAAASE